MNFKKLRAHMPALLASGISLELVSSSGRGKSEFVHDTIGIMSQQTGVQWGQSIMFLATQTPVDLIGYVFKGEREWDGKKVAVSEPTLPPWMITTEGKPVWEYKRGILFLDEYGQGEADVKRASAELLLNRRLGPWQLPDGWSVIAASNRASDRSGVTKSFDFVINRKMEISITDDIEAWTEWATEKGNVMPLTIVFANQNPQIVFADGVPDKQGPWCTPRSLVMADRLLQTLSGDGGDIPMDPDVVELVGGLIGVGQAGQYFSFVRLEREMPKYEHIVKRPTEVKVPEKPDAQMLVCYNLAHRVVADDCPSVIKYVERMPKEFAVTFAKAACKRMPSLVTTPAFTKWAIENSSLMAAIAK
jgi:hypothetical protein